MLTFEVIRDSSPFWVPHVDHHDLVLSAQHHLFRLIVISAACFSRSLGGNAEYTARMQGASCGVPVPVSYSTCRWHPFPPPRPRTGLQSQTTRCACSFFDRGRGNGVGATELNGESTDCFHVNSVVDDRKSFFEQLCDRLQQQNVTLKNTKAKTHVPSRAYLLRYGLVCGLA